jgi:hypothetical protein
MISVYGRGHWTQGGEYVSSPFNGDVWNGAVFPRHAVRPTGKSASRCVLRKTNSTPLLVNRFRLGENAF